MRKKGQASWGSMAKRTAKPKGQASGREEVQRVPSEQTSTRVRAASAGEGLRAAFEARAVMTLWRWRERKLGQRGRKCRRRRRPCCEEEEKCDENEKDEGDDDDKNEVEADGKQCTITASIMLLFNFMICCPV